jgi:hypothetical protein
MASGAICAGLLLENKSLPVRKGKHWKNTSSAHVTWGARPEPYTVVERLNAGSAVEHALVRKGKAIQHIAGGNRHELLPVH